jgi:peptidoglycan/LPS O-acetylase OafA/YrhL
MGFMRLGLALVVLIFHAGYGGGGGSFAVYGFYVISGYLIARVYIEQYSKASMGFLIFQGNRLLRIVPLFFVSSLIAYLSILLVIGTSSIELKAIPVNGIRYITDSYFSLTDYWAGIQPDPVMKAGMPPQFVIYFGWLPQFWTISIEFAFYVLAPLLIMMRIKFGRQASHWMLLIALVVYVAYSAIPDRADIGLYADIVYRNAIPTMFFFIAGMNLYELRLLTTFRIHPAYASCSTLVATALILIGSKHITTGLPAVYDFILWQFIAVAGIIPVVFSRPFKNVLAAKLDSFSANMSYGVYLNQSAALTFYFAYRMGKNDTDYLHNTSFLQYIILALATIAISYITYIGLERPVNDAKSRLKKRFNISNVVGE